MAVETVFRIEPERLENHLQRFAGVIAELAPTPAILGRAARESCQPTQTRCG